MGSTTLLSKLSICMQNVLRVISRLGLTLWVNLKFKANFTVYVAAAVVILLVEINFGRNKDDNCIMSTIKRILTF